MRKYILSFWFVLYISLFGLFTFSANISAVSAENCWSNWWNQFNRDVAPGTLKCSNSPPFSPVITECQSDGSWKDYYACNKENPPANCEDYTTGSTQSARCVGYPAAPTPTPGGPTLTPTPKPTATNAPTPTPDPTKQCEFPKDSGIFYNGGSQTCQGAFNPGANSVPSVYECKNNGVMEFIGTCLGNCEDFGTAPNTDKKCSNPNLIEPTPTPVPDPECVQKPGPAQQLIPQPGINCGIPADQLPEGTDISATACCYSSAADMKVIPLSCFIKLPGADDFFNSFSDKINQIFDCLPNWNCSPDERDEEKQINVLNVKSIKKALKEVPLCMPNTTVNNKERAGEAGLDGHPFCTCSSAGTNISQLCNNIKTLDKDGKIINDVDEQTACKNCMLLKDENGALTDKQGEGVWTAIGCINVSSENGIIQALFRIGIGLGGAIALLCNIYGAFLFQTSRGNPEGIKKAQDLITSCITGLLLIIFSVFILRLIGYNILRIPGFG